MFQQVELRFRPFRVLYVLERLIAVVFYSKL